MKFVDFVSRRMEPFLTMKVPYGCKYESMFPVLRDCIIDCAKVTRTVSKASELEWMQSEEGKRVDELCSEIARLDEIPTVGEFRQMWFRLNPPVSKQREECRRCGGSGWIVVEGEYGTSAAYPCSHKAESEADRRMGVRFAPSVAKHYSEEQTLSERDQVWIDKFRAQQRDKIANPPQKPRKAELKRVTADDVAAILGGRL